MKTEATSVLNGRFPESSTIEPNSPTARANASAAPDRIAGEMLGNTIRRNTCEPRAPREAAETLGAGAFQTFRRVTMPAIRWGVAYGVILTTARALGEFGAVSVVSGHLAGSTETLTLQVEDRYEAFDLTGAYAAAAVLALIAVATLASMTLLRRRRGDVAWASS